MDLFDVLGTICLFALGVLVFLAFCAAFVSCGADAKCIKAGFNYSTMDDKMNIYCYKLYQGTGVTVPLAVVEAQQ